MFTRRNGRGYDCVAIDLNTQRDFCESAGAHPVSNFDQLVPAIHDVIQWTHRHNVPIISSIESHRRWEVPKNGHSTLCCIDGTPGQRKIDCTLFPNRIYVEVDNTLAVSCDLFKECQQVIFRKRTDDLLANPKADRFLTHLSVQEFLVFGNCVESAVKAVALGLLARNKRVTVILDACGYWDYSKADLAIRQIAAKGAFIQSVHELLSREVDRKWRYTAPDPNLPPNKRNGNGQVDRSFPNADFDWTI